MMHAKSAIFLIAALFLVGCESEQSTVAEKDENGVRRTTSAQKGAQTTESPLANNERLIADHVIDAIPEKMNDVESGMTPRAALAALGIDNPDELRITQVMDKEGNFRTDIPLRVDRKLVLWLEQKSLALRGGGPLWYVKRVELSGSGWEDKEPEPPQQSAVTESKHEPVPAPEASASVADAEPVDVPASKNGKDIDPDEPFTIGVFKIKIHSVTFGSSMFGPVGMADDETVLTVQIEVLSGDPKVVSGFTDDFDVWVTNSAGRKNSTRSATSRVTAAGEVLFVRWYFGVAEDSQALALHFPSGLTVPLIPFMK